MKNKLVFLVLYLFLYTGVFAQNNISGVVTDSKNEGVFFATVILYATPNYQIVNSASTDENGVFMIENIRDGNYVFKVTMLGYKDSEGTELVFPKDHSRNLTIQMQDDVTNLSTVEVVAKVPLLEQKSDRLIVNVENSLVSSSGSMLDAMKIIPGVIVSQGNLSMIGQNGVTILINGKSTQYMDMQSLLAAMPAENIKRVELIHQPGAEFDASGTGAIINIILKHNKLSGTNGSVSVGLLKDYKWLPNSTFSISRYKGKMNMSGFLAYFSNASREKLDITRKIGTDIYTQNSLDPNDSKTYGANFSLDYNLTEKNRIGFAAQAWSGYNDKVQESNTEIDFASTGDKDISLLTQNAVDGFWSFTSINPYYSVYFDKPEHKFDFDINYFQVKSGNDSELATDNLLEPTNFFPGQRFEQPGETKILALKADYNKPVTDAVRIDFGAKYSSANLDNRLNIFHELNPGDWEGDISRSNHFLFDETMKAAYAKINYDKEEWSGTLGLRFEESYSKGESVTIEESIDRKISKLFPSFSLRRNLGNVFAVATAYSYRIDRPGYLDLNPFTTSLDPYTSLKGNPLLVPALTHSLRFNLIYENQPFFNIEYKNISDPMVEVTQQNDETGETFLNTVNLDKQQVFNAEFLFPLGFIPSVSGYGGIIANYNKYDSEYLGEDFLRSRWTYGAFIRSDISLPFKLEGELGGSYFSGALNGILSLEHFYSVQVGLGRKFWDNKAQITLGFDDVFYRFRHGEIKYENMDISFVESWYAPKFKMRFTYRFGNRFLKRKASREMGAKEEIERTRE